MKKKNPIKNETPKNMVPSNAIFRLFHNTGSYSIMVNIIFLVIGIIVGTIAVGYLDKPLIKEIALMEKTQQNYWFMLHRKSNGFPSPRGKVVVNIKEDIV